MVHLTSRKNQDFSEAFNYIDSAFQRKPRDPPEGFLFLCPREDFQTSSSAFRWPTCPAYWSLDPSGADRLSRKDATQLGFPPFELATHAVGCFWGTSVYAGLRQFHQAKGFDPCAQDVAQHLGYPLYPLSSERDIPWAFVNGDDGGAESNQESMADGESYAHASISEVSDAVAEYWDSEKDIHEEELLVPPRSLNVLISIQFAVVCVLVKCKFIIWNSRDSR
ncbi:hypothetical protein MSAN_02134800 [Mycena sanguinolenta]|uniref:Uncharacterized protein n=1 Tax=Mycena sanguinolenta TaxID=230812 RepID=A0A8H7CK37_9AGAR|nr:hypothetical protein MSAN_02134800 [Mycena sanguinolenta]